MKTSSQLLLVAGLSLVSIVARAGAQNAQQLPVANVQAQAGSATEHKHHKPPFLAKLDLTEDQKKQVAPIIADTKSKAMAIKSNSSLSEADKHTQLEALHQATIAQLKPILTADQLAKFQEMKPPGHGDHHKPGDAANQPLKSS